MKKLIIIAMLPSVVMAGGYHHKPIVKVIDKTITEKYYIDETVTIDNTVTVQETIDNTVTEQYFTNTTTVVENDFDATSLINNDNRLSDEYAKGLAGVGALAMLPTISKDSNKKAAVAVGAFQYVNETAIAFGVTGVHQDMSYKVGATYNGDDIFGGAGMAFGF